MAADSQESKEMLWCIQCVYLFIFIILLDSVCGCKRLNVEDVLKLQAQALFQLWCIRQREKQQLPAIVGLDAHFNTSQ